MPAYCLTGLTEEDLEYLEGMIRKDFDELDSFDELIGREAELIQRAERFGFYELANEMRKDIAA